jgi:hypothetical protein
MDPRILSRLLCVANRTGRVQSAGRLDRSDGSLYLRFRPARVAELADALALGASAFGRAGSSPALRTPIGRQRAAGIGSVEAVFARRYNG